MKKAKYLIVSLVIIISLLLGSGCQLLSDIDTSPPTSQPASDTTVPPNPDWTIPPTSQDSPLPDFTSVVAKVKPSVVAINTEVVTYDIFNRPFTQQGAGSGWVIDENGHIVTNNHVVEGAQSITVTLYDGRTLEAGIVGTDALSDLAVLKVNDANLPPVNTADSSMLNIGEWVLAIGNALGMGISAKEGIISRLDVSLSVSTGQTLYDLIEVSAAINPGNSGGPLVNMAGEVIGITSIKLASVEVEGLGYAISTNTARPIIQELVNRGYVVRPWLGVKYSTVNDWLALRYNLAVNQGAFVTEVISNSPAGRAGIRAGDIIVSFAGKEISTTQDLLEAIHSSQIGQDVEIIYWRGETRRTTLATLAESPAP